MDKGTYALLIELKNETTLTVGKLGEFDFPRGYYIYFGSALGGLEARINRHLKHDKHLHWHIDYLLQFAEIAEVWYLSSDQRLECTLCREAHELPGSADIALGFGSSDCRCPSHLLYFTTKPSFEPFKKRLRGRVFTLNRWGVT
jgi:Uri superfamily endonuclease